MIAEEGGSFSTGAQEFVIGRGARRRVRSLVEEYGPAVAVITSPAANRNKYCQEISDLLSDVDVQHRFRDVRPHAPIADTEAFARSMRNAPPDVIVAIGGGSASDTAKACALVLAEGGGVEAHCSVFSPPDLLVQPPTPAPKIPIIAVPTTLSGAEVTPGGGATTGGGVKRVFWDRRLACSHVLYDAEIVGSTPVGLLRTTGMNGFAHCAEGLYSKTGSAVSTALSLEGIRLFARNLLRLDKSAKNQRPEVVAELCAAAALSGMVISSARVGFHHAVCHVLGAVAGIPHGVANAIMLPYALSYNLRDTAHAQHQMATAMRQEALEDVAGDPPSLVAAFCERLGVPGSLQAVGLEKDALPGIAEQVMQDRGLYFNPRAVAGPAEVIEVLQRAWVGPSQSPGSTSTVTEEFG